jgi:hypothetical protein
MLALNGRKEGDVEGSQMVLPPGQSARRIEEHINKPRFRAALATAMLQP